MNNSIIDLGTEVLVDLSTIQTPHVRLLLGAIGQPLAQHSPWIAVEKQLAIFYGLPIHFGAPERALAVVA